MAPAPETIATDFHQFCLEHADPANAARYARYFTEGYDAYGFPPRLFETERDRILQSLGPAPDLETVMNAGSLMVSTGKYEETMMAFYLLTPCLDRFDSLVFGRVGEWLEHNVTNWAEVDVLCSLLLSPALIAGHLSPEAFEPWRRATTKWQRRAVPVAFVPLVKQADIPTLLAFMEPMMLDGDRFVQQGLGWFLREAWKVSPSPVEELLLRLKDVMPRKIVQYATEKMPVDARARFKAARKR